MVSRSICRQQGFFSLSWRVCFCISGLVYALASLTAEDYFHRGARIAVYQEDALSNFKRAAEIFPLRQDFVKFAKQYGERQ